MIQYGELYNFVNGDIDTSINYARYWHGYLVLFRPLLLFLNVFGIRRLLLVAFAALFTYFIYLLVKKFGKIPALIFAVSLISNGYFSASYSLESSPVFLTMMISCIILLKNIDKIKNFSIYIFVIACIANFVDFLTVPLITLGYSVVIYLLHMRESGKDYKECLKFIVKNSLIWLAGYAATWISKWIIYDFCFGGELVKEGFEQVFYRTQRDSKLTEHTILDIFAAFFSRNFLCTTLFAILLLLKFDFKYKGKEKIKESLPFLLVSMMPVTWYLVLLNHTISHSFFVFRHMSVFLCGFLFFLYTLLDLQEHTTAKKTVKQGKNKN